MKELMIMLSATLSISHIATEMHELSREVVADPENEEAMTKLCFYAQLLLTKQIVGDDQDKVTELLQELKTMEQTSDLLKPSSN